jgi:hypothetical protein
MLHLITERAGHARLRFAHLSSRLQQARFTSSKWASKAMSGLDGISSPSRQRRSRGEDRGKRRFRGKQALGLGLRSHRIAPFRHARAILH